QSAGPTRSARPRTPSCSRSRISCCSSSRRASLAAFTIGGSSRPATPAQARRVETFVGRLWGRWAWPCAGPPVRRPPDRRRASRRPSNGCVRRRPTLRMMRRLIAPSWHPSAVLLYPFMDGPAGRAALSLFGLVVLVFAVRAVQATPALTAVSLVLGVPILVLTLVEVVQELPPPLLLLHASLLAAFYFYTCYALIRYMFHDRIVTPDELFATGATFTVLAWAFAYVYQAVQVIWPGSFAAASGGSPPFAWFELLFLSFTNLTSVGL